MGFNERQPLRKRQRNGIVGGAAEDKPQGRLCLVGDGDQGRDGALCIALDDKIALVERTPNISSRRSVIDAHRLGLDNSGSKIGCRRSGFGNDEVDSKLCDFLCDSLDETFDAPFGCVINAEIGIGDLAALGRDLDDPPAALPAQMQQGRSDELDGAGEIGGNLQIDLRIRDFFARADQPIARIADHHVDLLKGLERAGQG